MPAAAAEATPLSPPVQGTITLFTFFNMLPETVISTFSGIRPSVLFARAAAYATAMGSVQPIAGRSSSFKMFT